MLNSMVWRLDCYQYPSMITLKWFHILLYYTTLWYTHSLSYTYTGTYLVSKISILVFILFIFNLSLLALNFLKAAPTTFCHVFFQFILYSFTYIKKGTIQKGKYTPVTKILIMLNINKQTLLFFFFVFLHFRSAYKLKFREFLPIIPDQLP